MIERIEALSPVRGQVLAVYTDDPDAIEVEGLGAVAEETGALILVLPEGTKLEELSEEEMARGGWVRVNPEIVDALQA